jgi:hypothetical protein
MSVFFVTLLLLRVIMGSRVLSVCLFGEDEKANLYLSKILENVSRHKWTTRKKHDETSANLSP